VCAAYVRWLAGWLGYDVTLSIQAGTGSPRPRNEETNLTLATPLYRLLLATKGRMPPSWSSAMHGGAIKMIMAPSVGYLLGTDQESFDVGM
jgi:hypothetical protein